MMWRLWITAFCLAFSFKGMALSPSEWAQHLQNDPSQIIDQKIREHHTFYGLASYYNHLSFYVVDKSSIHAIDDNHPHQLQKGQWLVIAGRFNVLAVQSDGLEIHVEDEKLTVINPSALHNPQTKIQATTKNLVSSIAPELDQVRYAHLWSPFAALAKGIEFVLVTIFSVMGEWGMTIIVFSLLMRTILLPVTLLTAALQRRVDEIKTTLYPQLELIKSQYTGGEAHERIMAAHKDLGVSPFFTLKPMVGLLIQIPLLIATFNALGEMSQFANHSFLWIQDLAYPDTIMTLPATIPLLGNGVNLLPFMMTGVTLASAFFLKNPHLPVSEVKKQKRNLYLMAFGFFILFYSFPAVMVFFWMMSNTLQSIQQKLIKS